MSTFYLIRHGLNDYLGRALAGTLPGVHLNDEGRRQAERLAELLAPRGISRVYSSPLERAVETAEPLARKLGLKIERSDDFLEVQVNGWSGLSMDELGRLPEWKLFNSFRSGTRAPGGELMIETQCRFVAGLQRLRAEFPRETIAITSHADPIKSALAYYLGVPLDLFHRIEISPASYSILKIEEYGPEILGINASA